jgi:acetoin utilization protein AcuC
MSHSVVVCCHNTAPLVPEEHPAMADVIVPWSPRLQAYNPSEDAERPLRRGLAWDLLLHTGSLDAPGVTTLDPPSADVASLERVHAAAYIRAVQRYSQDPRRAMEWEAGQWGFVPGMDTVAREGMHEAAADVCGAAIAGAQAVWSGPGRAFCPAPAGLHHAMANRASGFCIYNDCALAVRELLDSGARRIAYVDVDAHHGDGVQWIYYSDPRVLSISVHEFAYGFFPGTGGLDETGAGEGEGATLNVPLPPFAGDVPYLAALSDVIGPAVRAFGPEVLVVHLGADVHHADPLAHLQVTIPTLEEVYSGMVALADEICDGRLLAIAGGGYNPMTLGCLWALQLGALAGRPVPDPLPESWRDAARLALGGEPPLGVRDETAIDADPERRRVADHEGLEVVAQASARIRR